MKGLGSLIRLHRLKLTDQQRRLNALQATAHGYEARIEAIDRQARDEAAGSAARPEVAHTLGSFVQASLARRRALEGSLAELEQEMAAIREQVAAAFRELKRYELIAERRRAEARLARHRRERRSEDEVGMTMHRRNRVAADG